MDAILADSVKSGGRTGLYTALFTLNVLALSVGEFLAAGIFLLCGNRCTCAVMHAARSVSLFLEFSSHKIDTKYASHSQD